jgi:hypothetical protein
MSFTLHYPTRRDALMTQKFGENPSDYLPYGFPGHEGIDWYLPVGTPIFAVADGAVSYINRNPGASPYGIYVRMSHQGGQYETIYAHLSQVMVGENQSVPAGDVIALSGNTGHSTGPHLHFTLKKRGATDTGETNYPKNVVNPHPYLESSPPVNVPPQSPKTTFDVQVVAEDGLFLRNAPATGDVITGLNYGTIVGSLEAGDVTRRKLGQDNQWLRVRTSDGQVGYVAAWFVGTPNPALSTSGGQPCTPGNEAYRLQVDSLDEPLKLRQGPGTGYPILVALPHATLLESLESPAATLSKLNPPGQWLQVRTPDGKTGYVAAWYLSLPSESGATSLQSLSFGTPGQASEELRVWRPDDLQCIVGIGPKIAALLISVGIYTFRRVAALTPEQLKAVLAEGGIRGRSVVTWPEQARVLGEVQ